MGRKRPKRGFGLCERERFQRAGLAVVAANDDAEFAVIGKEHLPISANVFGNLFGLDGVIQVFAQPFYLNDAPVRRLDEVSGGEQPADPRSVSP